MSRFLIIMVWALVPMACVGADDPLSEAARELKAGNPAKAVALAEKAIATSKKDPAAWNILGEAKSVLREYPKAIDAFTEALTLDKAMVYAQDRRGDAYLKSGKFTEAISDFDAAIKARPRDAANHWRRGIALYYAGKYEVGAKQFELHKTVNPNDVENAAWHFLCVARAKDVDTAKKTLIDVNGDARVPMAEVQKLFAGTGKVKDVLAAAAAIPADSAKGKEARFYAHLYLGLYAEATGDMKAAVEHLTTAAEKYEIGHYMWDVAVVHVKSFKK